jgi:hypothetical protein
MIMEPTVERVPRHTAPHINQKIEAETDALLAYYAAHPEEISERLRELDQEWDIERVIETEAASTILGGFVFATLFGRKWLIIPAFASGMLLLHNLRGHYPLLPLFRRMGFRTEEEIAAERYVLKALRGDFEDVETTTDRKEQALAAFAAADPQN